MRKIVAIFLTFMLVLQSILLTSTTYASTYGTLSGEIKTEVSPNVTHIKRGYKTSSSLQSINILDVNLVNDFTSIEIGMAGGLNRLVRTSVLAQNNSYEGHRIVGAVNASFFDSTTRKPSNLLAVNNEIQNYGILGNKTESPTQKPVAFGITKDGKGIADYYESSMTFQVHNQTFNIDYYNQALGGSVLFSADKETTGAHLRGLEISVEGANVDTKSFKFGQEVVGKVKEIYPDKTASNVAIPKDGFVLSIADPKVISALKNIAVGDEIKVNFSIDEKWQDAQFILAAGPLLVKNGKREISMPTSTSFVKGVNPRTAVAVDATGKRIFLVTVDGRIAGHSQGTSLTNLADYLISIGASSAINLDGGGSTTMVVRELGTNTPVIVNRYSDANERGVSTILQVVNSAGPGLTRAVSLSSQPKMLMIGQSYKMAVKNAYDQYFNPKTVSAEQMTWTVEGGIGTFDGASFTPTAAGNGKIIGKYENATVSWNVSVIDPKAKPLAISSFDNAAAFTATSDRGQASISTNKSTAREGAGSVAVKYDFTVGEQGTKTANVIFNVKAELIGIPDHIGVWVYGDGNKNWLRAKVIDEKGTSHTIDFTGQSKMDWTGWKYVTAKLPATITTPVKMERLYFASPVASEWSKGTVYFDQLQAVYNPEHKEPIYTDVAESNWALGAITILNEKNLIKGYPNGTYLPNQNIKRSEVAAILARHLNKKVTKSTEFTDVPKEHFAFSAIQMMAQEGIITGREAGKFAPDGQLTRAEMSVIIERMLSLKGEQKLSFKDLKEDHWAYKSIQAIVSSGYAGGYPDGTFKPNSPITRAEFASILSKAVK